MKYVLLLHAFVICSLAGAQVDNTAFDQRLKMYPQDSNRFSAGLQVMAFGKNNEYFETTIEGYTLFGYQLNPYLSYQIRPTIRLDAGLYVQQDFGNDTYSRVLPTFTLKLQQKRFNFLIGTLEGSLHHRLIEPLYDFERVLNNRIENGIQFQWMGQQLFADAWVNWERMIYHNDPEQERFVAGVSLSQRLFQRNGWTAEIPLQGLVRHAGGQIDANAEPVTTAFNSATGLVVKREWTTWIREAGVKTYITSFNSLAGDVQPYKRGTGVFINPYLRAARGVGVMLSYWRGDQYLTTDGGKLYPVVSELSPGVFHQPREFYMLRVLYEAKISNVLVFAARVEPLYDLYSRSIQYSYGFYLSTSSQFLLGHGKEKK